MIRRHTRFQCSKGRRLAKFIYAIDRAIAVAYIHSAIRIKNDAGSNAEIHCKGFRLFERCNLIYSSIMAAGDIHFAVRAEGDAGRIGDIR